MKIKKYYCLAVYMLLSLIIALTAIGGTVAFADEGSVLEFEFSNVLDDLKDSTVNGEKFDESNFGADKSRSTQILSFVEFGYSKYWRDDYGLYVYIYNPKKIKYVTGSSQNSIQFRVGDSGVVTKYPLKFLNQSNDLYYKYRIVIDPEQRKDLFAKLNPSRRVYEVSGFELLIDGETNAHDYEVATTYTYSGFAAGYADEEEQTGSLICENAPSEVIEINDVRQTYYRKATDSNHAQELKSVYFAIDNRWLNKYGLITSIQAEYTRYSLVPILVVNNDDVYNSVNSYINHNCNPDNLLWECFGGTPVYGAGVGTAASINYDWRFCGHFHWEVFEDMSMPNENGATTYKGCVLPFKASNPRSATISRKQILEKLAEFSELHGDTSTFGYSSQLFTACEGKTEINTSSKDLITLNKFENKLELSTSLFDWFIKQGLGLESSNPEIKDIKPIEFIKSMQDIAGSFREKLFIAKEDEQDFIEFCDASLKADKTVVIFRYSVADYKEEEMWCYPTGVSVFSGVKEQSVRFQKADMGFDIISFGFGSDEAEQTIIPVCASPINHISGSQGMKDIIKVRKPDDWSWLIWCAVGVVALIAVGVLAKCFIKKKEQV